jgi:glycosyltransferase involved in cell wall biosynthesis
MVSQKHLLHIFPTFAVGGSQIRFGQLVRLHGARYRHTVIALDGNTEMGNRLEGLGVAIQSVNFDKTKTLQSWGTFRETLRAVRPDVLVTYNWGSIEWVLVNRFGPALPHLHIEDGFGPEEASGQLRRRIWMRRFALSGNETNTVLPSLLLETIAKSQWKLPPVRLHYIPNGIDCRRFAGSARAPAHEQVVIGTVATLRREKNIPRLLQAFAAVAVERNPGTLRLIIVGDGPERGALEQLAATLRVRDQVTFAGASTQPEDWLRKMDIFALSSDTEQMPLSVLEAMASGLPVVSTAVGDVAKMVSPSNTALVVPAGTEFEQALRQLISHPASASAIGKDNAERAGKLFDETVMAERYAQIIG